MQEETLNSHLAAAKRRQEAAEAAASPDERAVMFSAKRAQAEQLRKQEVLAPQNLLKFAPEQNGAPTGAETSSTGASCRSVLCRQKSTRQRCCNSSSGCMSAQNGNARCRRRLRGELYPITTKHPTTGGLPFRNAVSVVALDPP